MLLIINDQSMTNWRQRFTSLYAVAGNSSTHATEYIFCFQFKRLGWNWGFARSGHVVWNKLCWDANNTVGLSKQRKVGLAWYEFLCFGSPTALFVSQDNLFCNMWPDRAKGLLFCQIHLQSFLKMTEDFTSSVHDVCLRLLCH